MVEAMTDVLLATGNPRYFILKRGMDIVLSCLILILGAPLLLLTAIAIKLDTSGPVFFVQPRVGARRATRNGQAVWEIRLFPFYKFRSMVHNADQSAHEALARRYVASGGALPDDDSKSAKLEHDDRITRVGRLIRATSIDELPQLFNVLKGEMSLVGPRPVPIYEFQEYTDRHKERLAALPGMTGLWQVKGRGRVSFEQQIQMDIEYIRQASLWLDLKLLLLTVPAVLSGRGAG